MTEGMNEERKQWARELTETIDRLPQEVAKLVLGSQANRNARNAEKRGYSPDGTAAAHGRVRDAKQERVRLLGYDDGAGGRDAVRRRAA